MKKNYQKLRISKHTIANLKGGRIVSNTIQQLSRKETCLCMTVTSPCEDTYL
ncbi:hypothetical protein ACJD0Z_11240 [Flavobacteriaceae bacterium M23B6Z8]